MGVCVTDDQVRVAYKLFGQGERYVVLVHGWMVSGEVFSSLLPYLRTEVTWIVPDLRGTGDSDKPKSGYTLARHAKDVMSVVDHLGVGNFALVGHSMGGQIAQQIAATHSTRVNALALLNSVPASGIPLPEEATQLFRHSAGSKESQTAILNMACKTLTDEALASLLADAGSISGACIEENFDAWTAGGFADIIGNIHAPTLVLATDDPFLPPDFLTQAVVDPIPNASLVHLPGPGHYPQVEAPAQTAAILDAFLIGR